jgi:hypothetical protein
MSGQRHPDAETLADHQAGLVNGIRGKRLAAHVAGCAHCASVTDQLSEVSSALAAVPVPSLPAAFESQVTAALAAEAAARANNGSVHAAVPAAAPAPEPGPARGRRRLRPARAGRPRYGLRIRLAYAIPAAACLLAGFGYLASQLAGTAAVPSTAASPPSSAYGGVAPAVGSEPAMPSHSTRSAPESLTSRVPFLVTTSGISYHRATLREQVTDELVANKSALETPVPSASASTPAGAASASASGAGAFGTATGVPAQSTSGGTVPSARLISCVLHLTRDVTPSLVDQATYQGSPVYVIAVPDKVWVVGPGCTASKPDVITSLSLGTTG